MMTAERELLRKILSDTQYINYECNDKIRNEIVEYLAQPESLREDLREDLREGISLRDHFAGLAMQEFIALNTFKMGLTVTMAYDTADLMLAERGKVHDH